MNANKIDNNEPTSELAKGEQLMKTEKQKANLINGMINGVPHFRIVIGALGAFVIGCFLFFGGCEKHKHAILMIDFAERPDTDVALVKNTLKIGGLLRCGQDGEYIEKIHSIDKTIKDCCAKDSHGEYYIRPSILNWISSKGWKFQEHFADRYYFVK